VTLEGIQNEKRTRIVIKIGIIVLAMVILGGACFGSTVLFVALLSHIFSMGFALMQFIDGMLIASSIIYGIALLALFNYSYGEDSSPFSIIGFFHQDSDMVDMEESLEKKDQKLNEDNVESSKNPLPIEISEEQKKIKTVPMPFKDRILGLLKLFGSTIGIVFFVVDLLAVGATVMGIFFFALSGSSPILGVERLCWAML
jgi:hypothetical protein